jgi:multidrug efflux pump
MGLSVMVAIVLTPALCATMLRPHDTEAHEERGGFFGWFNRVFERGRERFERVTGAMIARRGRSLLVYAAITAVMVVLFLRLPTSFLPAEDQGILFAMVQAPVGATQERTMESLYAIERHFLENEKEAVESLFTVQGFSFSGSGQNAGFAFIKLKDWDERTSAESSVDAVAGRAMGAFMQIKDAFAFAFAPPPLLELGTSTGFDFFLKDLGGQGHDALTAARNQFLGMAAQSPLLANVRPNGMEDTPELKIDLDVGKASALGLSLAAINDTLSLGWGGRYIDDFVDRGRVKRVYLQAEAPFRMVPEDFAAWYVRNEAGEMVPFTAFASSHWGSSSPRLERYNGTPAMQINGQAAPGVSSGDAMAEVERLVAQLPPGFDLEWTGQSYQERATGAQTPLLYSLSLLVVFLCLAALYESWSIPTSVLLVVPLGVIGAVIATGLRGLDRDIYFQVSLLATVGLASKNAILIVEFAKKYVEGGMELVAATLQAVRDRLRPILMTSLAFGLGVLPLALASGAGSGTQRAIGTGVLGGMVGGTFLGLLFTPVFFVVVRRLSRRWQRGERTAPAEVGATEGASAT